jgi:putative tryptophan/tyrosine transport system substrate-binding protein
MRRREFVAGLGGAAVWPRVTRAQQVASPVIGVLSGGTFESLNTLLAWVHQGLAGEGYTENQNFSVQLRWADDNYDRLPGLATDLVRRRVNLIVVLASTPGALAAKAATHTIPIVFLVGTDPVQVGLVSSLARPGGNVTGVSVLVVELTAKCLSLIHELVPTAAPIAVLINPANRTQAEMELREVNAAAQTLGVSLVIVYASTPVEIEMAFATLGRQQARALVVTGETLFLTQRDQLAALAASYRVPAIYANMITAEAGGLMGYGINSLPEVYRVVGAYAGRILKGETPTDLPVQRATKIDLSINLIAAKALGIEVPETLLAIANKVIE